MHKLSDTGLPSEQIRAIQCANICVVILFVKMWHSAIKGAGARKAAGKTNNPEDAASIHGGKVTVNTSAEPVDENEARWKRIQINDWENIPMFFAILIFNFFAVANSDVITALTAIFTAMRVMHTVCFAYALQPWRSIVWIVGLLCTVALGINGVVASFS